MPESLIASKTDRALAASTSGSLLVSAGADAVPVFEAKATSAQASLSSLNFVACGDSQVAGFGLDDASKQAWPALVGQILSASVDNRGISGQQTAGILADLQTVTNPATKSFAWFAGRNDFGASVPVATIKANTQAAVAYFGSSRFLIFTLPFRDTETTLTQMHIDIAAYNDWIKATYPDNYIDVPALYAANGDPNNADDVADIAAGVTPGSLRFDDLHANAAGHAILAKEVLRKIATLAPDSAPVLEPKSLAHLSGELASKGSTLQGNAWVGPQEFMSGATSYGLIDVQGDNYGVVVDGSGLRRFGILKKLGQTGTFVRSTGITVLFQKSSSATDVTDPNATRTTELTWEDNKWTYFSYVTAKGATAGFVLNVSTGSPILNYLGMISIAGTYGNFVRVIGSTINYRRTSSTTDITTGTYTDEATWSDTGWSFRNTVQVAANGAAFAIDSDPAFRRLALLGKTGFYPQIVRASGSSINYAKSSSSSDATTGTLTTEAVWSDTGLAYSVPVSFAGGIAGGSVAFVAASSTTANQAQGRVTPAWVDSTHATRKGRVSLLAADFSGTDREGVRVESDGTQAMLSFFAGTAVAKQAAIPDTSGATLAALELEVNKLKQLLRNFNLMS